MNIQHPAIENEDGSDGARSLSNDSQESTAVTVDNLATQSPSFIGKFIDLAKTAFGMAELNTIIYFIVIALMLMLGPPSDHTNKIVYAVLIFFVEIYFNLT